MKHRYITVLTAVLLLMVLLCSCGMSDKNFEQAGNNLVIILNNHANANRYSDEVVERDIKSMLMDAITYQIDGSDYTASMNVSIIIADGRPIRETITHTYQGEVSTLELTETATYAEKAVREGEDLADKVVDFILEGDLRATDEGTNLPAALAEAARILRENPGAENHIYIYDTGIVTEGKFAMGTDEGQLDIQKGTVEEVMQHVDPGAFPDLSGIYVHFYGLGDVCLGQKDMRQFDQSDFEQRFIDFWTLFFENCGVPADHLNDGNPLTYAATGSTDRAMLWDVEENAYPYVRNVPFYETPNPELEDDDTGTGTVVEKLPVNLSASELGGFKGDSAEFKHPDQAEAALLSYYEYVLKEVVERPDLKLYVVGSRAITVEGQDFKDDPISKSRAIAISKLLQEMFGIAPEQIIEIDAGVQRFSWSSDKKEFVNGVKDPAAQAEHRVVTLIPATENNASRIAELAHEEDLLP